MIAGVGIDAPALRVAPTIHARAPQKKNDHGTVEDFFQYITAAIATTIMPMPLKRKRGFTLTSRVIVVHH